MESTEEKIKEEGSLEDGMVEATEAKEFELLENGVYVAQYSGFEVKEGDDGKYLLHKWDIPSLEERWVTETSSTILSEKSRLGEIFKALEVPFVVGENANLNALKGKQCQLDIGKHTDEKTKKTYDKILKHMGFAKGSPPSPSSCSSQLDDDVGALL